MNRHFLKLGVLTILLLLGSSLTALANVDDTTSVTLEVDEVFLLKVTTNGFNDPDLDLVEIGPVTPTELDNGKTAWPAAIHGRAHVRSNVDWILTVKRTGTGYPTGVQLWTGAAASETGSFEITSADSYISSGNATATFSHNLRFQFRGLSWLIAPGTYSDTVTFTLAADA